MTSKSALFLTRLAFSYSYQRRAAAQKKLWILVYGPYFQKCWFLQFLSFSLHFDWICFWFGFVLDLLMICLLLFLICDFCVFCWIFGFLVIFVWIFQCFFFVLGVHGSDFLGFSQSWGSGSRVDGWSFEVEGVMSMPNFKMKGARVNIFWFRV